MAVSSEQRKLFQEKISPYKKQVDEQKKEINSIRSLMKASENIRLYLSLKIAAIEIARCNTLVLMSNLSEKIQGVKNNAYLNDARKYLSNLITDMLNLFGKHMDSGFTENEETLEQISQFRPSHKLRLLQEFHIVVENIKHALGENSKWRWSFPDMYYRLTVLAKNINDFRLMGEVKDPEHSDYEALQDYLYFFLDKAQYTAHEFRSRYELSTQEVGDLQKIRDIFELQKKVYIWTGNHPEKERVQTSLDNIVDKIETVFHKDKKENEKKTNK